MARIRVRQIKKFTVSTQVIPGKKGGSSKIRIRIPGIRL